MSSNDFSPGPWTTRETHNSINIYGPSAATELKYRRHGAKRGMPVRWSRPDRIEADARLIAAAPELVDVLSRILSRLDYTSKDTDEARALIDRIRGAE